MALELNRTYYNKMCEFVGFQPHPAQCEFLDAFFGGERFAGLFAGRRWGKSEIAASLFCYGMGQPSKKMWLMAPTYDLCGKIWYYLIPWLRKCYGSDVNIRIGDMKVFSKWGAVLECKSTDRPDSCIGEGLDYLDYDEAATEKKGKIIWQQNVRPTLADRLGQATFTTTPRGHNWFPEMLENERAWVGRYSSYTNPYLKLEEIEAMKRSMDDVVFKQEILAELVTFAGMVYSMFDMDTHVISDEEAAFITKDWRTSVTCDPGMNNTMIQLIRHHPITGEDIVIRDVKLQNTIFDDALRVLNEWRPPDGYEVCVCDVAGKARGHETGRSFVGWMRDQGYEFRHTCVKSIPEGVNMVRGRLRNVNGEVHLKFAKAAVNTIQMMLNYHFSESTSGTQSEEPVKDGVYDHAGDALRYYITWRHRPVSRAVKH